jgi:serine protease AprX
MGLFIPNFPFTNHDEATILPTVQRVGALPDYRGRGVVMAFIDSGFYPHPDLQNRILLHADASTNHITEQTHDFEVNDLSWHGQMTSVIACGDGQSSNGLHRGIASEANLVLVKVSTPKGLIKETDILRGLRWVADTHHRLKIRIVNVSVGGDEISHDPNHPLHRVIRKLTREGVTVIAAAGNRSVRHLLPPASAADAITVGGIDDHNTLERERWSLYHHNYGNSYDGSTKPDILAPAMWIASPILPGSSVAREAHWLGQLLGQQDRNRVSTLLQQGYSDLGLTHDSTHAPTDHTLHMLQQRIHTHKIIGPHHQHVDGTSVAAPIVSAVAAQMLEANPRLTTRQIRAILTATAQPLPGHASEQQGAGILNAAGAVRAALQQMDN